MGKQVIDGEMQELSDQVTVLCAGDSYQNRIIFNPEFDGLPMEVQEEVRDICFDFAQDIGGIIVLTFSPEGKLNIMVSTQENDFNFDEIGCDLKIKQIQSEKEELFESLEAYFRLVFLDEDWDDMVEECE